MKPKGLSSYSNALYRQSLPSLYGLSIREEIRSEPEPQHLHDEIEYWLILKGTGMLNVNGENYPIQDGSLVRLFPFHAHSLLPQGNLHLLKLSFPLSLLLYIDISKRFEAASLNTLEFASPVVQFNETEAERIQFFYEDIKKESEIQQDFYEHFILADVIHIVNLYERQAVKTGGKEEEQHNLLWRVVQYMHVHFSSNAAEVAKAFQISVSYLNYLFRKITGNNFNENRHQVRIRNACSMMQFEELSIAFIANFVGYHSLSTFYRVFGELKGMPPEEYRREVCVPEQYHADTAWQILIYLFEHHAEEIDLEQTAEFFCISKATLTEILKRNYDMGFLRLLTSIRLIFARALLAGTMLPVFDIAMSSGFHSIRTFRRNFLEDTGMTPTEYRGENQK